MTPAAGLHYTPNRWLVLAVTTVVAARVAYGFWRSWETWRASIETATFVVASGIAGSMSAGAVVLGYYFVYWIGIRRRCRARP
jgi:chromate transport protein ChrA